MTRHHDAHGGAEVPPYDSTGEVPPYRSEGAAPPAARAVVPSCDRTILPIHNAPIAPGHGPGRAGLLLMTVAAVAALGSGAAGPTPSSPGDNRPASDSRYLQPTAHPPAPTDPSQAWFVPGSDVVPTAAERALAASIARLSASPAGAAPSPLRDPALATSPLSGWAAYYTGVAYARDSKPADAMRVLEPLVTAAPNSAVAELAARALADAAEAAGALPTSVTVLASLAERVTSAPDEVLKRLAEVASKAGEGGRARAAWLKLYYDYPLSAYAALAEPVAAEARTAAGTADQEVLARDLARAQRLFDARRYADARTAFERVLARLSGDAREAADLRVAECDYFAKKFRAAAQRLEPWLDRATRRAEARYYHLLAVRGLGRQDEYVSRVRALVKEFPESPWAADALNDLGSHYILLSDDAAAAAVFQEIVEQHPASRHASRAAWKYGWWQYKLGRLAEAAQVFERASARSPRDDYRPAWLYWAGRAREALGQQAEARARYELVLADYRNSYYGRLAVARVPSGRGERPSPTGTASMQEPAPAEPASDEPVLEDSAESGQDEPGAASAEPGTGAQTRLAEDPPNREIIARLLALERWPEAIAELEYARRQWGTSSRLEATLAWIYNRQGDLRRAITTMKRAYPQYLASGGEQLPRAVREVLFPIAYWDLIRKYSAARGLDPHLVAALIAQESTFQADVRSSANAWGLMQILPSTGRKLARSEKVRRFTTSRLTDPDTNLRLGTRYFASLIDRFDGAHLALASYNAGESRVVRWRAERPGLAKEEFIDDIPFPETQNYVKRILGTAEDYRALYPLKSPSGARAARR